MQRVARVGRERLFVIVSVFVAVGALAVGIPVSKLKADHCHPDQGQAPAPDVREPSKRTANIQRQRSRANAAIPESRPARSGVTNSSAVPAAQSVASLEEIYARDLPAAIMAVGQAVKAAESGDKKTELAELNKAVNMLVTIHAAIGKHVKPQFTNSRCPIMGSPIQRDKVDAGLTRDFKGQKVAFCCAGCPVAWDKLTDGQKEAKLASSKP